MTAIDWESKPEPWRSIGIEFAAECKAIMAGYVPTVAPRPPPDRWIDGQRLEAARRKKGLSQKSLGAKAGYSREAIGHYERGEHKAPPQARNDIAEALGVRVEDIWR